MNEDKKRWLVAGVVVGTVGVGLAVLAKKTPRDQWAPTMSHILHDVLGLVKSQYGDNEVMRTVERALDKFDTKTA